MAFYFQLNYLQMLDLLQRSFNFHGICVWRGFQFLQSANQIRNHAASGLMDGLLVPNDLETGSNSLSVQYCDGIGCRTYLIVDRRFVDITHFLLVFSIFNRLF